MMNEADRKKWLKAEIKKIQASEPVKMRCVMSWSDRVEAGECLGDIPQQRISRGQDTCSPLCQNIKRRFLRELHGLRKCRYCNRGFTKTEVKKMQDQRRPQWKRP